MPKQIPIPEASFRRNLLNTLWIQGPSLLLGFLGVVLLNRLLGPADKGAYSVFEVTGGFLHTLFGFNLGAAVIYFGSSGAIGHRALLRLSLRFVLVTLGLSALAAWLLYGLNPNDIFYPEGFYQPVYVLYYVFWVPLSVAEGLFRSLLHSLKRIAVANNLLVGIKVLRVAGLGTGFLLEGAGSQVTMVGYVLGLNLLLLLVSLIILYWLIRGMLPPAGEAGWKRRDLKAIGRYAGFLQLAALMQFLNYKFDYWVIRYFTDSTQLGLYTAAAETTQMIWVISHAIVMVLFPYLSDRNLPEEKKRELFLFFLRVVSTLSIALLLPGVVLSGVILTLLFGKAYAAAAASFSILLLGAVMINIARTHTVLLTAANLTRYNFFGTAIGLAATILLDFLLIPRMGITGAALATTLAYGAILAYRLWISRRRFDIPLRQHIFAKKADWRLLWKMMR